MSAHPTVTIGVIVALTGLGAPVLAQTRSELPRCDVIQQEPNNPYCFVHTVLETLAVLDDKRTQSDADQARVGGVGDPVAQGAALLLGVQRESEAYQEGATALRPFKASRDSTIAQAAENLSQTYELWVQILGDTRQMIIRTMNGQSKAPAGTQAAAQADLASRREAGARLLLVSSIGATYTMLEMGVSGRLRLTDAEVTALARKARTDFNAAPFNDPWWSASTFRQSARPIIEMLEDRSWKRRPSGPG
jgi:hypothetical protein